VLLDTSAVSSLFHEAADMRMEALLLAVGPDNAFLSAITVGELDYGIRILADSKRKTGLERWFHRLCAEFAARVLPIDREIALRWSELRSHGRRRGTVIPPIDGLIAATALEHGLAVVTRNARDFAATGVHVVDPWD
jgi:predicted nucleic acid-binding protein